MIYAASSDRVVAIHCNHGKGRTGTAIIAFMILIGYINNAKICLRLYNAKRFNSGDYGVDQPCQLRYLKYI
jgi:protein-tyrosine phosphatase